MWRSIKRCRSAKTYFLNNGFGSRLGVRSRLKALRQAKLLFEILATHTYSAFERQHFKRRIWLVGGDNCTVMRNIEIQIKSNNESLNFANFGLFSSIDPKASENIPQMMPMYLVINLLAYKFIKDFINLSRFFPIWHHCVLSIFGDNCKRFLGYRAKNCFRAFQGGGTQFFYDILCVRVTMLLFLYYVKKANSFIFLPILKCRPILESAKHRFLNEF